jgi:putative DNA primase/helicase
MVDHQAVETAFSANGTEPEAPKHSPDDDDLAVELAEKWNQKVRRIFQEWRVYQGGYWAKRDVNQVQQQVKEHLRTKRGNGVRISAGRVNSVTRLLESECHVSDDEIARQTPQQTHYINLQNGLFNITTFQLEAHRPDLYFIEQLPFAYDKNATAPTFKRFLETSLVHPNTTNPDHDLIILAAEAIGYTLTARTDLKVAFWVPGPGDSGKSTLLNLIARLAGSLHTAIDLHELGERFGLAPIIGKRVATCTEAQSNVYIRHDRFKALTGGGDYVVVDQKNKAPLTIIPTVKLWFAFNDAPGTNDRSDAYFKRLRVIPFNRSIPEKERIPDLLERMTQELPGIFNIVMGAYRRLVKDGAFIRCSQSDAWIQDYKLKYDHEATFLLEQCVRDPEGIVSSTELYQAYRSYMTDNGMNPKSGKVVATDWKRLGLDWLHRNTGSYWKGVRMK